MKPTKPKTIKKQKQWLERYLRGNDFSKSGHIVVADDS